MSYWIFFFIVMFAGVAMMVREGIWSNTITLINIIISGLVAYGFYSGIVLYLDEEVTSGQHTYWLDFAIIWALFCLTMLVCRALTGSMSKTKLRFKHPIDAVGGPVVGLIAAWVLASFVLATLHTSPMGKDAFGGKLNYDAKSASVMSQPDLAWLSFFEKMSSPDMLGHSSTDRFSAAGFVKIYGDHREKYQKSPNFLPKRGT
jgi:uncharacterized membrane protein required for colicin V production